MVSLFLFELVECPVGTSLHLFRRRLCHRFRFVARATRDQHYDDEQAADTPAKPYPSSAAACMTHAVPPFHEFRTSGTTGGIMGYSSSTLNMKACLWNVLGLFSQANTPAPHRR